MSSLWRNLIKNYSLVSLRTCRAYTATPAAIPIDKFDDKETRYRFPSHSVDDPEIEKLNSDATDMAENDDTDPFCVNDMTSVQDLFEARVHMGHKAGMWNPLMLDYIHGSRGGMHIFDLSQTLHHLRLALNVAGHIAYKGGVILFVNERSQFDGLVQDTARDCGEFFVTPYWRKGVFTNSFKLIRTTRYPDLVIILSASKSIDAVKEVAMSNIPSIAVTDSDSDPRFINYPIPGNDDSPTAVMLYCKLFRQVIQNAKQCREKKLANTNSNPMQ